jgi:hypothetical protein
LPPGGKKRLRECGVLDAVVDFFGVQAGWQEFCHPKNGHAHFRGHVVRQRELKLREIFLEFLSGGFLEFPQGHSPDDKERHRVQEYVLDQATR